MMVLGEIITESEDDMLFWGREKPNARAPQHRQTRASRERLRKVDMIGLIITRDSFSSAQEKTGKQIRRSMQIT